MAVNISSLTPKQLIQLKQNNPTLYYQSLGIAQPTTGTPSTTQTTQPAQNLGSKDISQISQKELIDAFAAAGNTKAQESQKNNYVLPTPTQTKTSPSQATTPALPTPEKQSSLVEFASVLDQVTSLARSDRHMSELGILEGAGFTPGQVRVGDMARIVNLLDTRSSNRTETLQTAAMDAYQAEQKQKAEDKTKVQELALQLVTKGVDSTTIQGVLNMTDPSQAILAAAGALKDKGGYSDVREINNKLVGIKEDGTTEVLYDGGAGGSGTGGFTLSSGQVRYDAEGNFIAAGPENDTDKTPDYATAETFIDANKNASYEELRAGLLSKADDLNFSVTDVDAVLAKKGIVKGAPELNEVNMGYIAEGYLNELGYDASVALINSGTISVNGNKIKIDDTQKKKLLEILESKRSWLQKLIPGGK